MLFDKALKIILLVLTVLPHLASAEIFQWRDNAGRAHFSDQLHPGSRKMEINPGYSYHAVKYAYDGDTLYLENGKKIRLLGINTPEVEGRNKLAEPWGEEAKLWLTQQLANKKVRLQMDMEKKDKYARTLAHVFTEDGIHINAELVKRGYAAVNIYPPNLKYIDILIAAQEYAETEQLGLWQLDEYRAEPIENIVGGQYRGWKRLQGKVQAIRRKRQYSELIFSEQIKVRINNSLLDLFPELTDYQGHQLEIRGWPTRSKDQYAIFIRHPSAIKILD